MYTITLKITLRKRYRRRYGKQQDFDKYSLFFNSKPISSMFTRTSFEFHKNQRHTTRVFGEHPHNRGRSPIIRPSHGKLDDHEINKRDRFQFLCAAFTDDPRQTTGDSADKNNRIVLCVNTS